MSRRSGKGHLEVRTIEINCVHMHGTVKSNSRYLKRAENIKLSSLFHLSSFTVGVADAKELISNTSNKAT